MKTNKIKRINIQQNQTHTKDEQIEKNKGTKKKRKNLKRQNSEKDENKAQIYPTMVLSENKEEEMNFNSEIMIF